MLSTFQIYATFKRIFWCFPEILNYLSIVIYFFLWNKLIYILYTSTYITKIFILQLKGSLTFLENTKIFSWKWHNFEMLTAFAIAKKIALFAISIAKFSDRDRPAIFRPNGDRRSRSRSWKNDRDRQSKDRWSLMPWC